MKNDPRSRTIPERAATSCSSLELHNDNANELQKENFKTLSVVINASPDVDLVIKIKIRGHRIRQALFNTLLKLVTDSPDHGEKKSLRNTFILSAILNWLHKHKK